MPDNDYIERLCTERHKTIEAKFVEQGKCLETLTTMLNELKEQTAIFKQMWSTAEDRLSLQAQQIDELRLQPANKWDKVAMGFIMAIVVGAVNTAFLLFK